MFCLSEVEGDETDEPARYGYVPVMPDAVKIAAAGRLEPEEWLGRRQRYYLREIVHRPDPVLASGFKTRGKNKSSLYRAMIAPLTKGGCWYCSYFLGEYGEDGGIDHLTPTSRGGTNADENLVLSCHKCNNRKGDMTLDEYRSHLGFNLRRYGFKFWGEICFDRRRKEAHV